MPTATVPQIITVDYSAPNVAKEMHVGHLRSTVIGDALVRMLEFEGHRVIRMNHLGDWGTQFGMLTQHMLDTGTSHLKDFEALGTLYREAKERFDSDPAFADSARRRVVALQSGDPETIALWQDLVDVSLAHINALYGQLDVTLTDEHVMGESFYNDRLQGTVEALLDAGVAVESEGAVVVVSERFTNPDGSPAVLIIRKTDGGFGYGTTDLGVDPLPHRRPARRPADLHHRRAPVPALPAGLRRRRARRLGRSPTTPSTSGSARCWARTASRSRPARAARSGSRTCSTTRSCAHAACVDEKSPELPEAERAEIARAVGIGAVKYADLSTTRQRDLLFSFDRMLALNGNSAPYLMYACTRAASIVAKAGEASREVTVLDEAAERALVVKLSAFGDVLREVEVTLEPHRLCNYLYELAGAYTAFYDACPVLKAEGEVRSSRLALCALTAETLETGLGLLGITVPSRM